MKTTAKLALFAASLVVVLGLGAALGAAVGPAPAASATEAPVPEGEGVVAALSGYRFVPHTALAPGGGTFRFTIDGPDGTAVTTFDATHERALHLVVVNRELTDYHHVHPTLGVDGAWSVDLPALAPGSYRAVADFVVHDGPALALGVDLSVPGLYRPAEPPAPSTHAMVDGYDVELHAEQGSGGVDEMTLTVSKNGQVVTDLEPYLGAAGHLVAFRAGDLAYAHVHPLGGDHGAVRFEATLPSAGRYRLFFDFQHGGVVRTAEFSFDQGIVTGSAPAMDH